MKNKSGRVSGRISVNGQPLTASFKRQIGFVDQHDVLMPTLTVVETIMFSALLRLPKTLTMAEKTQRVLSVLHELQLAHIADSKVGNEVTRGISGGEKRRVSVGMELVTQPKALFLDEPTSGMCVRAYGCYGCLSLCLCVYVYVCTQHMAWHSRPTRPAPLLTQYPPTLNP